MMRFGSTPLLEHLRVFHSRDPEETCAWLRNIDFYFDRPHHADGQLDVRMNGIYLPGMYLGYIQYGTTVSIRASPTRNDYWVQLPLRGHLEVAAGRDRVDCTPLRAWVASPTRNHYYDMRTDASSARIHMCLNRAAMTARLAALLGEPPRADLEFAPVMDLTCGFGHGLARYVLMAVSDLERAGPVIWSPVIMSAFEELVMTALLLSHPHNYSEALRCLARPIAPRDVKRAIDYMHEHLGMTITLADVVKASGVPGRTLFKHFKDYRGVSPMRYMRHARMDRVREALQRARPEETVTQTAMQCGFSHMGRFSVEYRRRFGENPSETLRRGAKYPCDLRTANTVPSNSDFRAAWWMSRPRFEWHPRG